MSLRSSILILYGILFTLMLSLSTCVDAYELKEGASIDGLKPEITDNLPILEYVWHDHIPSAAFVITSGTEPHVANRYVNSLHKEGLAIDIRTKTVFDFEVLDVAKTYQLLLGDCYDVVIEEDHLHIEYDEQNGRCSTDI